MAVGDIFTIPDVLANFPWKRILSECYPWMKAESSAWTESYHLFSAEGLRGFNACDFNLLGCLTYSLREREIIRLGCDFMNLLYCYDEYTDITDGEGANDIRNITMDAMRDPQKPRPDGELLIGEMMRDFWLRLTSYVHSGSPCIAHFMEDWDLYTAAVVREADDRTKHIYRTFEEYLQIRRLSSACFPSFAICEFGLDLPEDVFHHPLLTEVRQQANDLVTIPNDIASYAMEKSRGLELHNSVELVMKEQNLGVQGAIDWIERYTAVLHESFLANVANLPSWSEDVDKRVEIYVNCLGQWIRGNDDWTFESGRYFGDKGLLVQKNRLVAILPPSTGYVKISEFCSK